MTDRFAALPSGTTAEARTCHFCALPIPADERAVEAKTKNAWAHFECWYDGVPLDRDPTTGERTR
jgi:hypothetical protein